VIILLFNYKYKNYLHYIVFHDYILRTDLEIGKFYYEVEPFLLIGLS